MVAVGKSKLVAEAVRDQRDVAWVRATTAAAELPLGAFAHLLPAASPSANLLRWASESIAADVLVVDDAHALDPVSAALVHFLAAQRTVRLLVTVRSGERPPDAVVALWKDDLLPSRSRSPGSVSSSTPPRRPPRPPPVS
ncbi:hypothetical protein [Nonomuraea salmonea]|uniref:ATP-binding protein n=1 Tax=Nonomuraea salmonea TaxID=46181 RepID=A0ABV5P267_9ACTN